MNSSYMDSNLVRALNKFGIRSLLRSVPHSLLHTGRPDSLVLHPNVIVDISRNATLSFKSNGKRVIFGHGDRGATHPNLGKSKFEVTQRGEVVITGGTARIGPCSVVFVDGLFSMGNSYINSHTRIICGEEIRIGDDCAIAWNVTFLDDNRHEIFIDGEKQARKGSIIIEDDVWIGHDVLITKGITVGKGSVIASGSVVVDDVPEYTLVAGQPAEVLERDVQWE